MMMIHWMVVVDTKEYNFGGRSTNVVQKKTRTPLVYKKQRARVRVRENKQTQKVPKENVHTQAVLLCCGT